MRLHLRAELRVIGGALPAPLGNARAAWRERRGLLLRLVDERGTAGLGEASPLPGYSPDTLDECSQALAPLCGGLALDLDEREPLLPQLAPHLPPPPAARFALESALLDLLARRRGCPPWRLLRGPGGDPHGAGWHDLGLPLAALLPEGPAEHVLAVARAAAARGFAAVKLKIGRPGRWAGELALARRIAALGVPLRLDANGAWTAAEAAERLTALRPLRPQFLEEPCADGWPASAPVALALDESLARPGAAARLADLLERGLCHAVVLKPALLGGFAPCLALAAQARAAGAGVVVSHLFDGPVALRAATELALALPARPAACGLAPHAALPAFHAAAPEAPP